MELRWFDSSAFSNIAGSTPTAVQNSKISRGLIDMIMESEKTSGEEAEDLLREAVRLALEENAGNEDKEVAIHVTIKGTGAWIIDADGLRDASTTEAPHAKLHLTYQSPNVFLGLAHK